MAKTNRFVVLIVDDCSAHPIDTADVRNLSHIKLVFLPPDVASLIQPYDMEIIKNVKANYMKKIVCPGIIMHIDSCVAVTVSSLDAMHMLKSAWEDVNQSSIVNCFGKAGFTNSNPCQKMTMIQI